MEVKLRKIDITNKPTWYLTFSNNNVDDVYEWIKENMPYQWAEQGKAIWHLMPGIPKATLLLTREEDVTLFMLRWTT